MSYGKPIIAGTVLYNSLHYASKLGVHPATLARHVLIGRIVPTAQTTTGDYLFDGHSLNRDYEVLHPVIRTSSPGYAKMMTDLAARGITRASSEKPSNDVMIARGLQPAEAR